MEVVDPDIGRDGRGDWRIVWFGVSPSQMNPNLDRSMLQAPSFYCTFTKPVLIPSSNWEKTGAACNADTAGRFRILYGP